MPDTQPAQRPLHVVVLAAGKGTRMRSSVPKVMHPFAGVPMLGRVLDTVSRLTPARTHVVYGHGAEMVRATFADVGAHWVLQAEQLGTGHAVKQTISNVPDAALVLVVYGDVPLVRAAILEALVTAADGGLAILTAVLDDPTGYGRIIRNQVGAVRGVVEEKDATPVQATIREVNTGFLAAPASLLGPWLSRLDNKNAQGEFYLTDVVGLAAGDGILVTTQEAKDIWEIRGVNSRAELAELERHYQRCQAEALMDAGVSIADPDRFDVRGGAVTAGRDSHFDINVIIEGPARFGERVTIGANSVIKRTEIGDDVVIHPNCVIEDAVIGANSIVGPFARIRPGTRLDDRVHVGNFVEIKNSELAVGSKVNHLSYIGDSSIGRDVNVGAGVITCNYDGANKYRTIIEDGVFVGSDCQLIAPVSIGKGATVGAGSTITGDVPPDTLALARARQQHVSHWRRPRKKKN